MRSTRYINSDQPVEEVKMIGQKAVINQSQDSHSKLISNMMDINSVLTSKQRSRKEISVTAGGEA